MNEARIEEIREAYSTGGLRDTPETDEAIADLLDEITRLKSNYKIATDELDNIMLHYRNMLPSPMRERIDRVREQVRGLA